MGLFEDIDSEPNLLKEIITAYESDKKELLKKCSEVLKGKEITFTAEGTSYCSALAAHYWMAHKGMWSSVCEAGELYYYKSSALPRNAALVLISASGESAELKLIVKKLSGKIPIIVITNHENSTVAKKADLILPMFAGEESLLSTKTYMAALACAKLLTDTLQSSEGDIIINNNFKGLPVLMSEVLGTSYKKINEMILAIGYFDKLIILGRGPLMSNVHDTSMILKEAANIGVEGMEGAYFRHGPVELIGPKTSIIVFAPSGITCDLMINTAKEAVTGGSKVLLFTDKNIAEHDRLTVFKMPSVGEEFAPFLYILPIQVLVTKLTLMSGKVKKGEIGLLYQVGKSIEEEPK
jgi:glutamine---fructose-6-phosphate transaminase (isomerizing)